MIGLIVEPEASQHATSPCVLAFLYFIEAHNVSGGKGERRLCASEQSETIHEKMVSLLLNGHAFLAIKGFLEL